MNLCAYSHFHTMEMIDDATENPCKGNANNIHMDALSHRCPSR